MHFSFEKKKKRRRRSRKLKMRVGAGGVLLSYLQVKGEKTLLDIVRSGYYVALVY